MQSMSKHMMEMSNYMMQGQATEQQMKMLHDNMENMQGMMSGMSGKK
jgi:hypothetical protein